MVRKDHGRLDFSGQPIMITASRTNWIPTGQRKTELSAVSQRRPTPQTIMPATAHPRRRADRLATTSRIADTISESSSIPGPPVQSDRHKCRRDAMQPQRAPAEDIDYHETPEHLG